MTQDTDTDTTLDNESALIAASAAEDTAAAEAAKAAAAPPVVEDDVTTTPPDPVAAALAENTAAQRQLAEQIATDRAAREAAAVAAVPVVQARDFDAELAAAKAEAKALAQQYDDGDIDATKYEAEKERVQDAREAIVEARAEAKIEAKITERDKANAERAAADADAKAESDWTTAQTRFFADPGNAALVADPIKKAAFVAAVEMAGGEGYANFDELLVNARTKITGVAAVDTTKTLRDAQFDRTKEAGGKPVDTLRDVPSAGNADSAPGAALDNLGISELEDALFKMSDADRSRYLAGAPGGLNDNPRATS